MSGVLPLETFALATNKLRIKFSFFRSITNTGNPNLDVPEYNHQMQILFYVADNQYLKLAFLKSGVYYKFCTDTPNGIWIKL